MSRILYGPVTSANALRGRDVSGAAPADGDALRWDAGSTQWKPAPVTGGGDIPRVPSTWAPNGVWTTPLRSIIAGRTTINRGPWATPYWSGAGGTVTRLVIYCSSANASVYVVMGIYSDAGYHPGTLLGQTIPIVMSSTGIKIDACEVELAPNTLYWLASMHWGGNVGLRYGEDNPILGMHPNLTGRAGIRYSGGDPWTDDLPETFPVSSVAQEDSVPLVGIEIA